MFYLILKFKFSFLFRSFSTWEYNQWRYHQRCHELQKQPPEVFCDERCFQKFCKIHRKTLVPEHRFFAVNFAKFRRTPFLQNNSGRLLLDLLGRKSASFIWCIKACMSLNGTEWLIEMDWKNFEEDLKSFGNVFKIWQKNTCGKAAFQKRDEFHFIVNLYSFPLPSPVP